MCKWGDTMKDIARMALQPGMEVAVDVFNYQNELIVPAGTVIDANIINKLARHSIICVPIKEEIDYAITHFEKVRLSKGFSDFNDKYMSVMPVFKEMMYKFVWQGIPFSMDELMQVYTDIYESLDNPEKILDYLYNMLPMEDDMTYAHCLNAGLLSGLVATWFSLPEKEANLLIQCGFFYDIGKLKLPNSLIWKPDKLTNEEFEQMKTHTFIGFQILQNISLDSHVLQTALMHHERFDGSGYPSKLQNIQIDLYARYMAIIDAYEAMTSARTYRQSLNPFQVIDIFEKDSQKYDVTLLRPILYRLANHMVGLNVLLSDDRIAEVILINQSNMGRPLLRDQDGTFIDLIAQKNLQIKGIY